MTSACAQKSGLRSKDALASMLTIPQAYAHNITSLDTSLLILKTMRERRMEPAWRLDLTEGDMYSNVRFSQKAIPFYERALASDDISDSVRMALYKRMMDIYDVVHDDERLMYYIYELRDMAERLHDNHFLALAEFTSGKRLHFHGDTLRGYALCRHALDLMKTSTNSRRLNELRAFYAEMIRMYMRDKRYDEAIRLSVLHEAVARDSSQLKIRRIDDRALRQVYALRASLLAHAGRRVEADAAYTLWRHTTAGNAIDDTAILDYLMLTGHHEEALAVIRRCRQHLASEGDDISYRSLDMIFKEVKTLAALEQYDTAAVYLKTAMTIADSLHVRASRAEMTATYQYLQQQKKANRRSIMLNWLAALLVLLVLVVTLVVYYNRVIRRRNLVFLKMINGLQAYRNESLKKGEAAPGGEEPASDVGAEAPEQPAVAEPRDEDERLFVEMDRRVTREKLFLQPDLDRSKLMLLVGVDKNRFGRMMSKYATNVSIYVNTKRVEYGAHLLASHPEYTIASIAESCGMRNTVTFNRSFKDIYGVTPSEYRANVIRQNQNGGGNKQSSVDK